ncbi:hypothetical protein THAOC_13668, partial [Thalassiosira oceanica]
MGRGASAQDIRPCFVVAWTDDLEPTTPALAASRDGQLFPSPPKCEELCEGSAGAGRSGNAAVGRAASGKRADRRTDGRRGGGARWHTRPLPGRPRAGEDGDPRDGRTTAGGPKLLPGNGDGMDGLVTEGRGHWRESRARVRNAPPGRTRSGDRRGGRSAPRRGGVARGWRPPDGWERDGDRQAHPGEREVRRPGGAPPWAPGTIGRRGRTDFIRRRGLPRLRTF